MKDAKTLLAETVRAQKVKEIADLLSDKQELKRQYKERLATIDKKIKAIEKSK